MPKTVLTFDLNFDFDHDQKMASRPPMYHSCGNNVVCNNKKKKKKISDQFMQMNWLGDSKQDRVEMGWTKTAKYLQVVVSERDRRMKLLNMVKS